MSYECVYVQDRCQTGGSGPQPYSRCAAGASLDQEKISHAAGCHTGDMLTTAVGEMRTVLSPDVYVMFQYIDYREKDL